MAMKPSPLPKPGLPNKLGNISTMPVRQPIATPLPASLKDKQAKLSDTVQRYAAGNKHYGSGRPMPNIGKTANKAGYVQRDAQAAARKQALLRRAAGGMK
jgi:hypothetical protein